MKTDNQCQDPQHLKRLYPTFKEWKLRGGLNAVRFLDVYILPLRNENKLKTSSTPKTGFVYILPLRNENCITYGYSEFTSR